MTSGRGIGHLSAKAKGKNEAKFKIDREKRFAIIPLEPKPTVAIPTIQAKPSAEKTSVDPEDFSVTDEALALIGREEADLVNDADDLEDEDDGDEDDEDLDDEDDEDLDEDFDDDELDEEDDLDEEDEDKDADDEEQG